MKITDIPVGGTDVINAFGNLLRFHYETFPVPLNRSGPLVAGGRAVNSIFDAVAKSHEMAKQKFRPARRSGFSGVKGIRRVCRSPEKALQRSRADFLRRHHSLSN
jgi:hypothetical protein